MLVAMGRKAVYQRLQDSLMAISRRLGGERYAQFMALMRGALARLLETGDCGKHRARIIGLLSEYYDPLYARHMQEKSARIVFRDEARAVTEYLCASEIH